MSTIYRKRCHFFSNDGQPRRLPNGQLGCRRGSASCQFVHPDNPLWDRLPPSLPPAPHPHRSPPTSASTSRRNSILDDDSRTPRPSPAMPAPTTIPKPPPTAPPIPPPPPLPTPPAFLSFLTPQDFKTVSHITQRADLTVEQKEEAWHHRIKLWSSSTRAYQKYLDLNAELEELRRFSRSAFLLLDDESKNLSQKRIADIEQRTHAAKKEHEDAIVRLIESDTWPTTKTQDRRTGNDKELKELVLCIAGLRDTITELHAAVNDLAERNASKAKPPAAPTNSSSTTLINLDPRPRKKRRLSTDDVDMVDMSETSGKAQRIPPSHDADLEHFHDRLIAFESRLSDVENMITQHNQEHAEELESKINVKLAEFRLSEKSSKHECCSTSEVVPRKLAEAEQNLSVAGDEIEEMSEAMASLFIQVDAQNNEIKQLRAENAQVKARCATIEQQAIRCSETSDRHRKERAAFMAAYSAHLGSVPRPAPLPSAPIVPIDHIMKFTDAAVTQSIRTRVQPLIEDLKNDASKMVYASRVEVKESLSGKMDDVLRMVESVSNCVDRSKTKRYTGL